MVIRGRGRRVHFTIRKDQFMIPAGSSSSQGDEGHPAGYGQSLQEDTYTVPETQATDVGHSSSAQSPPRDFPSEDEDYEDFPSEDEDYEDPQNNGRIEAFLVGQQVHPSGKISNTLRESFENWIDDNGSSWKNVAPYYRDLYINQVKKAFYWDKNIDGLIMSALYRLAAICYSDMLSHYRKMLKRQPSFVKEEIWNKWMETWSTETLLKKSKICYDNRSSGEGGPSRHTGGSRSAYAHTQKMDDYERLVAEASQPEPGSTKSRPVDYQPCFLKAAGEEKKNRVYGIGSQVNIYYPHYSFTTNSRTFIQMDERHKELEKEIELLKARDEQKSEQLREVKEMLQNMQRFMMQQWECRSGFQFSSDRRTDDDDGNCGANEATQVPFVL